MLIRKHKVKTKMAATPRLLSVLSLVALLIVIIYISVSAGKTVQEPFADSSSPMKNTLIIATAKWCPHCVKAMPEFEKVAKESPIKVPGKESILVKLLDETTDKAEIGKLDVSGFPSILLIDNTGKRTEYGGQRTYNGIMDFINQTTAPSATS